MMKLREDMTQVSRRVETDRPLCHCSDQLVFRKKSERQLIENKEYRRSDCRPPFRNQRKLILKATGPGKSHSSRHSHTKHVRDTSRPGIASKS